MAAALALGEMLELYDRAALQHPLDRVLTLLMVGDGVASRRAMADLPLGERDARLLEQYGPYVGDRLEGWAECGRCGERLELCVSTDDVRETIAVGGAAQSSADTGDAECLRWRDFTLRVRRVTTRDLAALATEGSARDARHFLAEQCALEVEKRGEAVELSDLPPDIRDALVDRISEFLSEQDPGAEILLDTACPACEGRTKLVLDIGEFVWAGLSSEARERYQEIQLLARSLHWSEAEILALSDVRRRTYLHMLGV